MSCDQIARKATVYSLSPSDSAPANIAISKGVISMQSLTPRPAELRNPRLPIFSWAWEMESTIPRMQRIFHTTDQILHNDRGQPSRFPWTSFGADRLSQQTT